MAFFLTFGFVSGLWVIRGRRLGEGRKIFVEEYFLSDQNSRNHDIRHWTAAKGMAAERLADAAVVFGAGPSGDAGFSTCQRRLGSAAGILSGILRK